METIIRKKEIRNLKREEKSKAQKLDVLLKKKHYGFYKNSAVEICLWTKKAIRNQGYCYKQKFYGIPSHRCMEFTPIIFCQQNCVYCWRPMEIVKSKEMINFLTSRKKPIYAEPDDIVKNLLEQRKKLLIGFGGNKKVNKKILDEALKPVHFAISLVGEPTLYSKLCELINLLNKKYNAKSIFVVTNGQEPKMLARLQKNKCLPTQLYLSVTAPNEKLYKKINRPFYKDGWKRLNNTINLMKKLDCRRVIRLTLIKGWNDKSKHIDEFAELINKAKPDFVEIKAYMFLGYSMKRLKRENMPTHDYVKAFSFNLLKQLGNYHYEDEHKPSRIILLKRNNSRYEDIIKTYKQDNK